MTDLPDEPDRLPTQAELDAEDLAELQRTSGDRDRANLYPGRPKDPGPAPAALLVHTRVAWWGSAVAGLICVVYGVTKLGTISDLMRDRLLSDAVQAPQGQPTPDRINTFAQVIPVGGLILTVLFLVAQYVFLVAAVTHHSRHCRNFFLTLAILQLMCIPVGLDLLFRYPSLWSGTVILGWIQCGLLLLAVILSLRRSVDRWLPESTRMRPSKMLRARP